MDDKTLLDQKTLEASLRFLGEITVEIVIGKSLSRCSYSEALSFVEAVIDAYQHCLLGSSVPQPLIQPNSEGVCAYDA